MNRIAIILLLLLCTTSSRPAVGEEGSLERWDRAVCLHTEQKRSDGRAEYSSAFLVRKGKSLYMVTAAHAAQETHGGTKVLFRSASGDSKWITLGLMSDKAADPWRSYETSDVSVMHVSMANARFSKELVELEELAIDIEDLATETPSRNTAIEVTGYPLAIGTLPPISALSVPGHVASRELEVDARWGKESIYFATPTFGGGTSGGPAFAVFEDPGKVRVVGMYIGFVSDQSGPKMSKFVPSRIIRKAVEREAEVTTPAKRPAAASESDR